MARLAEYAALAALALLGAVACDGAPAYELRWTVVTDAADLEAAAVPRLASVQQCSSHGIATVRAELYRPQDVEALAQQLEIGLDELLETRACAGWVDQARALLRADLEDDERLLELALDEAQRQCREVERPLAIASNPGASPEDIDAIVAARCGRDEDAVVARAESLRQQGIEARLSAIDLPRIDRHEWPCLPRGFERRRERATGGALDYEGPAIMCLYGQSRRGTRWISPPGDAPIASRTLEVELVADKTVSLYDPSDPGRERDIRLLAPPQCQDGIDNDGDGLVDLADPACRIDPTGPEQLDDSVTLVAIDLEVFGGARDFQCRPAEIEALRLLVLDADDAVVGARMIAGCNRGDLRFDPLQLDLDPGTYRLRIEGLDYLPPPLEEVDAEIDPAPRAGPLVDTFEVDEGGSPFVQRSLAFGPEQWNPALEQVAAVAYIAYEDLQQSVIQSCRTPSGQGLLEMDTVTLRLRDQDGASLDPSGWTSNGDPVTVAGDLATAPCTGTQSLIGPSFLWGLQSAQLTMGVDDEVCFSTEDFVPLMPRTQANLQRVPLTRVLDDEGRPPAACVDCVVDDDCGPTGSCNLGICSP